MWKCTLKWQKQEERGFISRATAKVNLTPNSLNSLSYTKTKQGIILKHKEKDTRFNIFHN